MEWGLGWTLIIRAPKSLKIVHWWALFVQSIYCFSQKLSEELCVMKQKGAAKFKWKLPCGLKNDIRNSMVNFDASTWKSENLHFDWIRLSKVYKYLDVKVQKSYLVTLKSDAEFEENLTLSSKNDMRNLVNFNASSGKSGNLLFHVLFLPMDIKFQPKNYSRIISHGIEKGSELWRKTGFLFENDMRNLIN